MQAFHLLATPGRNHQETVKPSLAACPRYRSERSRLVRGAESNRFANPGYPTLDFAAAQALWECGGLAGVARLTGSQVLSLSTTHFAFAETGVLTGLAVAPVSSSRVTFYRGASPSATAARRDTALRDFWLSFFRLPSAL